LEYSLFNTFILLHRKKLLGNDHFDKIQYQFYLDTRYHLDMFAILLFALFFYYGLFLILLSLSKPK